MKIKLPLTGPLKWLAILAFVGIYPVALVWVFAPDSDIGKACFGALGNYLLLPFLAMLAVGVLNLLERGIRSWAHWKRVAHEPGMPFLVPEECAAVFKQSYVWLPFGLCVNAIICVALGSILQAAIKLVIHFI